MSASAPSAARTIGPISPSPSGAEHDGAGAVAEQHAVLLVVEVGERGSWLGADHQHPARRGRSRSGRRRGERGEPAGAGGADVDRPARSRRARWRRPARVRRDLVLASWWPRAPGRRRGLRRRRRRAHAGPPKMARSLRRSPGAAWRRVLDAGAQTIHSASKPMRSAISAVRSTRPAPCGRGRMRAVRSGARRAVSACGRRAPVGWQRRARHGGLRSGSRPSGRR